MSDDWEGNAFQHKLAPYKSRGLDAFPRNQRNVWEHKVSGIFNHWVKPNANASQSGEAESLQPDNVHGTGVWSGKKMDERIQRRCQTSLPCLPKEMRPPHRTPRGRGASPTAVAGEAGSRHHCYNGRALHQPRHGNPLFPAGRVLQKGRSLGRRKYLLVEMSADGWVRQRWRNARYLLQAARSSKVLESTHSRP